jgi:hypothetical protein
MPMILSNYLIKKNKRTLQKIPLQHVVTGFFY